MSAVLLIGLLVLFIAPLAMPGRRSLLACGSIGAALFGSMWLYHLDWSRKWGSDGESAALQWLYFWALGAFVGGVAVKTGLLAWLSRR